MEITNKSVREANYGIEPLKRLKYGSDVVWPHAFEEGDEVIYFSADEKTSVECYVASFNDTVMEYTYDGATWTRQMVNRGYIPFGGSLGPVYIRCKYEVKDEAWNKSHGCMWFADGPADGVDVTVGGNLIGVMPSEKSNYSSFFRGMKKLVDASDLVLPVSASGWNTRYNMTFEGCTNLLFPPKSEYLYVGSVEYSHARMFYGCEKLSAPMDCEIIFAGTGIKRACDSMYCGCKSIKKCQTMKAVSTGEYAFHRMYADCESLEDAGSWDVSSIGEYAFYETFSGCRNLKACISSMGSIVSYKKYTFYHMYENCTSLTVAVTGSSGGECACVGMFKGCVNLKTAYLRGFFYGPNALVDTFAGDYDITELRMDSLKYYTYEVSDFQQITGGILIPKTAASPVCKVYNWQYCQGVNIKKAIADETKADRYDWM